MSQDEFESFVQEWNERSENDSPTSDYEIEDVNRFEVKQLVNTFFKEPHYCEF